MSGVLVDQFMASYRQSPPEVVLDFDATDDPLHGNQDGRFFHGYYDCYCFLPLYVFCGDHLPASVILDEKRLYPNSCGLRVMVMVGGAGFKEIRCCGHSITVEAMQDMKFGQMRVTPPTPSGPEGDA